MMMLSTILVAIGGYYIDTEKEGSASQSHEGRSVQAIVIIINLLGFQVERCPHDRVMAGSE